MGTGLDPARELTEKIRRGLVPATELSDKGSTKRDHTGSSMIT
jgi:hypothetical protein